jgi:hypothetical protein
MLVTEQGTSEGDGTREQLSARYPDEQGHIERDGVRVFNERRIMAASPPRASASRSCG